MILARLPNAFTELYRSGRFDYWGAPYTSLSADQREEIMCTRWSGVLVLAEIEWDMTPDDVLAFRAEDMSMRPGLVRFAGDGCGGAYCWYPPWQEGAGEPPVIFWSHDGSETGLFARSFAECVLRCILRDALGRDDGTRPEHWEKHAAMIGPWLQPAQRELLRTLGDNYSRPACQAAEARLAGQIGTRPLLGTMPPASYSEHLPRPTLARLYARSEAFWHELVDQEGHEEYRPQLDLARANARRFS